MRIDGLPPAPWEPGGVTTKQMEREQPLRISRAPDVGRVVDSGYSANDHEFLPVPELDVRLAAGSLGIENYHETQIGEILLRRSFLESFGLPIDRMTIVYADGDSMVPIIRHRSPMLFYQEEITDPRQIDPRIVYAINHGGKMIVKCIKRERDGRWLAKSINLDYKPFPLQKEDGREVRIIGRILWSPYDLRNGVDERLLSK
ncbi:LexA family transcriptional repressor [Bordetella genomosp. 4]|uniref:LexA family transcriptional repressor n=2 Tax=Bordetella genomosp. 4 TaxID=463044 RepID=A0A261USN7_9BORD|nr:LexA family transcriptional repressor [Bordetella genomosp. 4]